MEIFQHLTTPEVLFRPVHEQEYESILQIDCELNIPRKGDVGHWTY